MTNYKIKRVYEPMASTDGFRVYIDRLWPRGLSHETFHYDLWEKDIAPSKELMEWFHEDRIGHWNEFENKYRAELAKMPAFDKLKSLLKTKQVVTLLYSSHDEVHNNAVVVLNVLQTEN